jgi:hypothetical protein
MSINCYRTMNSQVQNKTASGIDFPCGNLNSTDLIVPCCAKGDFCLSNGFCKYPESSSGGSGYYVSGCTNPTGVCPTFPDRCTKQALPDVTWNQTSQRWHCCGVDSKGKASCDNPTDERFDAPGSSLLETYFTLPRDGWTATSTTVPSTSSSSSSSISITSATAVSSSTGTPLPDPTSLPSTQHNGLSSGTKAGIGIGAALAALAILGAVLYFIFRKRGRRRRSEQSSKPLVSSEGPGLSELQGQESIVEMDTTAPIHELEAKHRA